jgi:hypothetical protein
MKAHFSALSIALGVVMIGCARQPVDLEAERAALLRTIEAETRDLLAADTAALRAAIPEGDTAFNIVGGQILRTTRANALEGYDFATVRYTAATILDSGAIHLSPDGRMAWVATRYRFTYTRRNAAGADQTGELINAALAVYEKKGSRWVGAALAQTFPAKTQ